MVGDFKKAFPVILAWLSTSTVIYLQLYWFQFSINPFDYIFFTEVINYVGNYLLIVATLPTLIGIVEFIFPNRSIEMNYQNDASIIRVLVAVTFFCGALSLFLPKYWFGATFIYYAMAPVTANWAARTKYAKQFIKNQALRISVLLVMVLSPYCAISTAIENSLEVKSDKAKTVKLSGVESFNEKSVIIVGRLGEYTFVKTPESSVIHAILSQEIKSIEFSSVTGM